MNLAPDTLVDEVEPFLLRSELVVRTPRGRRLTAAASSICISCPLARRAAQYRPLRFPTPPRSPWRRRTAIHPRRPSESQLGAWRCRRRCARLGMKRSTLERKMKISTFPPPLASGVSIRRTKPTILRTVPAGGIGEEIPPPHKEAVPRSKWPDFCEYAAVLKAISARDKIKALCWIKIPVVAGIADGRWNCRVVKDQADDISPAITDSVEDERRALLDEIRNRFGVTLPPGQRFNCYRDDVSVHRFVFGSARNPPTKLARDSPLG